MLLVLMEAAGSLLLRFLFGVAQRGRGGLDALLRHALALHGGRRARLWSHWPLLLRGDMAVSARANGGEL